LFIAPKNSPGDSLIGKPDLRPPFRNIGMGSFGLVPGFGDIEVTIAASKIFHIRGPVNTGADDVLVELPVSRSQPAGTAHIAITIFVEKKCLEQVVNPFPVFIKKIAFGLLGLF
jgi:hypothetical protein